MIKERFQTKFLDLIINDLEILNSIKPEELRLGRLLNTHQHVCGEGKHYFPSNFALIIKHVSNFEKLSKVIRHDIS